MSDFFGGILDSISHVGDDVGGFFNSAIGQAVAKGAKGGMSSGKEKSKGSSWDEMSQGFVGMEDARYSPQQTEPAQADDFTKLEIEWLNRLHRFAGLDDSTEVKLGGM